MIAVFHSSADTTPFGINQINRTAVLKPSAFCILAVCTAEAVMICPILFPASFVSTALYHIVWSKAVRHIQDSRRMRGPYRCRLNKTRNDQNPKQCKQQLSKPAPRFSSFFTLLLHYFSSSQNEALYSD